MPPRPPYRRTRPESGHITTQSRETLARYDRVLGAEFALVLITEPSAPATSANRRPRGRRLRSAHLGSEGEHDPRSGLARWFAEESRELHAVAGPRAPRRRYAGRPAGPPPARDRPVCAQTRRGCAAPRGRPVLKQRLIGTAAETFSGRVPPRPLPPRHPDHLRQGKAQRGGAVARPQPASIGRLTVRADVPSDDLRPRHRAELSRAFPDCRLHTTRDSVPLPLLFPTQQSDIWPLI